MTWQDALARFRTSTAPGAWRRLPRAQVADDLAAVLAAPDSVNQGPFGFCGIAAFMRFWLQRQPDAFVAFATALYDQGAAALGRLTVAPNAVLRGYDYLGELRHDGRCPPGQWLVLGSLQDHISELGFFGTVDESWTRFLDLHEGCNPRDLVPLFEQTGLYRHVDDRVDWTSIVFPREPWLPFPRPRLGDLLELTPGADCDVILLVNDALLEGSAVPHGWLERVQLDFPNHYVALAEPFRVAGDVVTGTVWTWAGFQTLRLAPPALLRHCYGAVVADC